MAGATWGALESSQSYLVGATTLEGWTGASLVVELGALLKERERDPGSRPLSPPPVCRPTQKPGDDGTWGSSSLQCRAEEGTVRARVWKTTSAQDTFPNLVPARPPGVSLPVDAGRQVAEGASGDFHVGQSNPARWPRQNLGGADTGLPCGTLWTWPR